MKVIFVHNLLDVGGIETNLVRLTRELSARGHDVIVAARSGRLDDDVVAAGGRLAPLEVALRPGAIARDVRTLRRLIRHEQPDVVHVFSAASAMLAWPATRMLGRRRPGVVGSIMGLHASPEQSDWPVLARCMMTSVGTDRLIVMAPAIDTFVRRLPIRRRRVVHGSAVGIDLPPLLTAAEIAEVRAELGLPHGHRFVLTAGRLEPRKSHELFVRAAARVISHRDDVHFFIAGDGELEVELRAEIDRIGVGHRVILLGSRADVPRLFGAADVCVRPGIVEGFIGITVMEAQAMETPVVAFDLADVRLAVEHERTGLLVPLADTNALATAVERLLDDDALVARIVAEGRKEVERVYSIEAVGNWLLGIYHDVCRPAMTRPHDDRRMLVFDAAFSLAAMRARDLEQSVMARDLGGWFGHVWSVHPLVGADPGDADEAIGPITTEELSERHTIIEAHVGRYSALRRLHRVNLMISQLGLLVRLSRLVRRERIDVVRVGDPYWLGLLGLALARRHGIPLVVRINANYDTIYSSVGRLAYPRVFRKRWIEKCVDRFVLRRATLVVAANRENLSFAIDNGADPAQTDVFPYGNLIHPAHFEEPAARPSVRTQLGVGARPLIPYVTRLEPVKFPQDLLVVAEVLRDEGLDAVVTLIGAGSMRDALEADAASRGLGDRVVLAGSRDQRWIAACLAEAAVIAAPHNGRALVESALSGRPIVAYDLDWHRELLVDGVTGRLVPSRDARAMGLAIADLVRDEARSAQMGAAGRARALTDMDPSVLASHERSVYGQLINAVGS